MTMTLRQADLAKWFEDRSDSGEILNADQARCLEAATSIDKIYNLEKFLAGSTTDERFKFSKQRLEIRYKTELASFDGDGLTQLVLAAHNLCVRVTVSPMSSMSLLIAFNAYNPETKTYDMFSYHPTLVDLGLKVSEL